MSRRRWESGSNRLLEVGVTYILLLFFIGVSFGVVSIGAKAYQNTGQSTMANYKKYTPISYVRMKVRHHDRVNGVAVLPKQGQEVLVLREQVEGVGYETWIYVYEGYLRELYMQEGDEIDLAMGMSILPLRDLKVTINEKGLVTLTIQDSEGQFASAQVALRSGGEMR